MNTQTPRHASLLMPMTCVMLLAGCSVLASESEASPWKRLKQMIVGEIKPVTQGPTPCLPTVDDLDLPESVVMDDARLRGDHLIVVRKADRRIQRFMGGEMVRLEDGSDGCWPVGLGFEPEGHKTRQGDGRTPEGWYRTSDKPWSQWYAAIAIHYPNADDAQVGSDNKIISQGMARQIKAALAKDKKPKQNTALGGEILIHGQGATDWTLGCVGMDNADIDALRATLPANMRTDVLVLP